MGTLVAVGGPVPASATSGTATITGGTLGSVFPTTVAFSATLTGVDQTVATTQAINILDNTGTATGWNVTLTSVQFKTAGSATLPVTAATDQSVVSNTCNATVTCTPAVNGVSGYPLTVPAAAVTAPTAVKIYSATAGTGIGGQTSTHNMQLAVAANSQAGSYTSVWTYSVTSGP